MSDANKEVIRAYVEAFNTFDVPRMREICAPDARIYGDSEFANFAQAVPIWQELHEGLKARLEILAMISEGDEVAVRLRETGRFVGYFRGLAGHAPTGRAYHATLMEWFRVKDGLIAERWGIRDNVTLQLEVLG